VYNIAWRLRKISALRKRIRDGAVSVICRKAIRKEPFIKKAF
jgi:hypothetical protein